MADMILRIAGVPIRIAPAPGTNDQWVMMDGNTEVGRMDGQLYRRIRKAAEKQSEARAKLRKPSSGR